MSCNEKNCVLCLTPTWTWNEVLEHYFGKKLLYILLRLCEAHQPQFRQQIVENFYPDQIFNFKIRN